MLRATYSATYTLDSVLLYDSTETTLLKYKTGLGSANWGTPSGGQVSMTGLPILTTHSANGTIARAQIGSGGSGNVASGMLAGLTGGKDVVVDDEVISAAEACNITQLDIQQPLSRGTVKINIALANRILEFFVLKSAVHFSAAGSIDVYSGSAPDVEAAATGTLLISFTTSTTSWNDVVANACTLAASLNANGVATGTAGYARFTWTHGGNTYVIQGTIGTSGTDFVIDSTSIVNGNPFSLTAATIGF